jgi:hypothetical protein
MALFTHCTALSVIVSKQLPLGGKLMNQTACVLVKASPQEGTIGKQGRRLAP